MRFVINLGVAAYIEEKPNIARPVTTYHHSYPIEIECEEDKARDKVMSIIEKIQGLQYD